MKESLELLKAFANQGDNIWLQNKLELLEAEISLAITEGKVEIFNELKGLK